jgi:glucose/mannose-6-phosphate isomerase
LALELEGKLILIYGGGIFSGVARRWKTQFNENAKVWAFFETIPELLHNSIEAYRSLPDISERTMVLLLQPNPGADQLGDRYRVVAHLLQQSAISYRALEGRGGRPLQQLLGMLLLGDYVSYYLAMLNGVDPSPTPTLSKAKTL